LDENFPSVKYFKGKSIVELDSERLRSKRKKMGLTLQQLAERIGSTVESVHRYEKGASASLSTAEKLEDVLEESLVRKIDLLERKKPEEDDKSLFEERIDDKALEKVHDLGVKVAVFRHSPFKAFAQPTDSLLIGKADSRQGVEKSSSELSKTKRAFQSKPFIICSETKFRKFSRVPVVGEEELDSLSKFKDLMALIRERERS
jgi:predicted transcriptional regulator